MADHTRGPVRSRRAGRDATTTCEEELGTEGTSSVPSLQACLPDGERFDRVGSAGDDRAPLGPGAVVDLDALVAEDAQGPEGLRRLHAGQRVDDDLLVLAQAEAVVDDRQLDRVAHHRGSLLAKVAIPGNRVDRKSTRLNSSHANISYAVFCLKKKTNF